MTDHSKQTSTFVTQAQFDGLKYGLIAVGVLAGIGAGGTIATLIMFWI